MIKEHEIITNKGIGIHRFPLKASRESTGSTMALLEVEAMPATLHEEGVSLVPPLKLPVSLPCKFHSILHISLQRCRERLFLSSDEWRERLYLSSDEWRER